MGARAWINFAEWDPIPLLALCKLQAQVAAQYDLREFIDKVRQSTVDEIRGWETEGDRHGLLGRCRDFLRMLDDARDRLPTSSADERVALLRRIHVDEIGNVLDVTSVSEAGEIFVARLLPTGELRALFGTPTPHRTQAQTVFAKLPKLGRGQSVCFPVFNDADEHTGWCFAGYTVD